MQNHIAFNRFQNQISSGIVVRSIFRQTLHQATEELLTAKDTFKRLVVFARFGQWDLKRQLTMLSVNVTTVGGGLAFQAQTHVVFTKVGQTARG